MPGIVLSRWVASSVIAGSSIIPSEAVICPLSVSDTARNDTKSVRAMGMRSSLSDGRGSRPDWREWIPIVGDALFVEAGMDFVREAGCVSQ